MITGALITILSAVISFIVYLLPTVEKLPLGADQAITFFASYWSSWGQYFPVGTFVAVLSFVIVVETSILTFHLFDWAYKKLRG